MAILSNKEHEEIIGWMVDGNGFMIHQKKLFETEVIPQYYQKPTKYSSFTRKLSRWGFRRVPGGPLMGMYYHPLFKKDHPQLCKRIHCVPTLSDGVLNPFESSDDNATIYDKKGRAINIGLGVKNDDISNQLQPPFSQYQGSMLSATQGMLPNQYQTPPVFAPSSSNSATNSASMSTTAQLVLDQALRQNMQGGGLDVHQQQNLMNRNSARQGGNIGQNFLNDPSFLLNGDRMTPLLQNPGSFLQANQTMQMNQGSFNPLALLSTTGNSRISTPYDLSFNRRNMQMADVFRSDEERRFLQASQSPGTSRVAERIRELDTLIASTRRESSEQQDSSPYKHR